MEQGQKEIQVERDLMKKRTEKNQRKRNGLNKWRMTWIIMKCVGKSVLRKEGTKRNVLVISMGPYDYATM